MQRSPVCKGQRLRSALYGVRGQIGLIFDIKLIYEIYYFQVSFPNELEL